MNNQKLNFIVLACLSFVYLSTAGQPIPTSAPLNPEFVNYQNNQKNLKSSSVGEGFFGLIPEPVLPNFPEQSLKKMKALLPEVYDLRTAGPGGTSLLTSVKNQGECGSCWTFATMGSMEGFAKKNGLGSYDFSENNLKECHGFEYTPCQGGNTTMSAAYLARLSGPVSESDDPYSQTEDGCTEGHSALFRVKSLIYLPKNTDIIKQAIMDYGALHTNLYFNNSYYNSSNYTYYYSGTTEGTNHAVLLVGWDDKKSTSGGTGAWIIRNSWGPTWGQSGFFYVSYNDTRINSSIMSFKGIQSVPTNSHMFSHNEAAYLSSIGFGDDHAYGMVKFTTGGNSFSLKSVGTFISSGGSSLGFEIYSSFDGTTLSNLLGTIASQDIDFPGYHSFELDSPITLPANSVFYVKAYYNTPGYNYPIPFESVYSGFCSPPIESGKCWISYSGNDWIPFGSGSGYPYDLCINTYAEQQETTPVDYQLSNTTVSGGISSCYSAQNILTVAGDRTRVIFELGSSVNLIAGTSINLLPGFHAQTGS